MIKTSNFGVKAAMLALSAGLVLAACGSPAPTPTGAVPTPTVPSAPPTAAAIQPTATAARTVQDVGAAASLYPPEVLKQLLADNFYFGGMHYAGDEEPQYGGTAIISNRGDLPGGDPMTQSTNTFANVINSVLGNGDLVRPKRSNIFQPEPFLSESWTADSSYMNWTFKMRPGVKWHDGTPLVAEDIKFWIDLAYFPPKGRRTSYPERFGPLKEVQVIDSMTLKLVMNTPAPYLLEKMSTSGGVTHARHLLKPIMDAGKPTIDMVDSNWVALGPFKYDLYQKGSSYKVVKSPVYFEKDEKGRSMPYLDGILFPFIPDANVMVSAFRAGRIDVTSRGSGYNLQPDWVAGIKKTLGDKAWFPRLPYVAWGGGVNALKPPFDDVRIRRAVNLYSDRPEGIKLVQGGFALPSALIAPGTFWYNPETPKWPGFNAATKAQDQAEAKRLVKEAGLEGSQVSILCRDIWVHQCEFLNITLTGMGMKPKLEMVDNNLRTEKVLAGTYQITVTSSGAAEANDMLTSYTTFNPSALTKHNDKKVDEYAKAIGETLDQAQRRKLVNDAEFYVVVDQAYYAAWYTEDAVFGYRTYIKGEWVAGYNIGNINDRTTVWMDQSMR